MIHRTFTAAALAAGLALGALAPAPAAADEHDVFVEFRSLTPNVALEIVQAAMKSCEEKGYQVAVAVVDRFGVPQTMMRARFAGPHTPETARRKAWTAVSFRTDTTELIAPTSAGEMQSGARDIPRALMLGGGVQVMAGGRLVAGVGVSGAPTGEEDAACAKAGIAAVEMKIAF